jgi:hypothetical protein
MPGWHHREVWRGRAIIKACLFSEVCLSKALYSREYLSITTWTNKNNYIFSNGTLGNYHSIFNIYIMNISYSSGVEKKIL